MSERSPRLRGLRPRSQLRSPHVQKVNSEASDRDDVEDVAGRSKNNRNNKQMDSMSPRDESDDNKLQIEIKDEEDDLGSDEKSDDDRNYECKTCKTPVGFPTLVEYLRHLRDEHKEKGRSYECPHCDFSCQHPKKLKAHCNSEHKDSEDFPTSDELVSHQCTMCPYLAGNSNELENHQRVHHLKRRFFRCTKCSYMTHVRARYTKHVKYHSMPMIKCLDCDFRTPYKWNLDRHTRNHGGGGTFQCRACNFTADIRQSLTVHETNHHEPPVGLIHRKLNTPFERKPRNGPKRYNQVGASDYRDASHSTSPSPVKNRTPVKSPISDVGSSSLEDRRNAIASAECIALKCEEKGCQFITAWDSEMQRHLAESHAPSTSPVRPRKPLPMLIPLSPDGNPQSTNASTNGSNKSTTMTTTTTTTTLLKVPRVRVRPELAKIARDTEMAKLYGNRESVNAKKDVTGGDTFERRNASFFDKLKERLMTTSASVAGGPQVAVSSAVDLKCWCTFEASSPEELASHSQTHHTALSVSVGVSRCPKCRRRCKSSNDLQMHMRICQTTINDLTTNDYYTDNQSFVTNSEAASYFDDFEFPFQVDWDGSFGALNSSGSSVEGVSGHPVGRRVFKCPHCLFWASTASRFHVHIVGHLNRKPFECSLCAYRSNWRWDITKHIKLKAARDPAHMTARVLMTDETGRRNYSKYNKYLAQIEQQGADESGVEEGPPGESRIDEPPKKILIMSDSKDYTEGPPELTPAPGVDNSETNSMSILTALNLRPPPPLKSAARSHGQSLLKSNPSGPAATSSPNSNSGQTIASVNVSPGEETKRTLWKCKRCTFRDSNKETVLAHVKSHYDSLERSTSDSDKTDFTCPDCPYTSSDPTAMAIHRVHHRPNLEAIFKCYLCPYYVTTKAELLEHARLHGEELAVVHQRSVDSLSPAPKRKSPNRSSLDNDNSSRSDIAIEKIVDQRSRRTSENATTESTSAPLLLDTRALPDTPLVWVSRPDGTLAKMLKCRHCPHVSLRRAEVRDHETMHGNSPITGHNVACPDCSFACSRRDVMETHAEMHVGSMGTVHCLVDEARTDSQQLDDLTTLLGLPEKPVLSTEPDLRDSRLVHCCHKCPARFLCEKELRIHLRYHSTELAYSCQWCSYAARQPAHLLAHHKAHSSEYQDRTRFLLSVYGHSQRYAPPNVACVESEQRDNVDNTTNNRSTNVAWIVVESSTSTSQNYSTTNVTNEQKNANQVFTCAKCPARYFKLDALEYHMTLHGSNNRFKCSECDYSSKTAQNLLKHQVVHRRHVDTNETTVNRESQLTDLDVVTTSRGNPNYVYSGCLKNGRFKEKRYKCHKCPSAFEKREQYRVHLTLHGAKQRYRCDKCDYSVKYYANYTQHVKKHHNNAQAQASRRRYENEPINLEIENLAVDNALGNVRNGTKNRRKSTISSAVGIGQENGFVTGTSNSVIQLSSNQDRQSIVLMQKKGVPIAISDANNRIVRCQDCPFSGSDKEAMDAHRRRHGIERLTPTCPHCDYVPRKDENVGDHVRLHFTRLYKPESYLIVELLSLTVRSLFNENKNDDKGDTDVLFRECADGTYLPITDSSPQSSATGSNANGYQEKVIVDPNTVDRRASKYAPLN